MATAPRRYVDPPLSQPYGYGLFSVADFPAPEDHFENGVEYQPLSCGLVHSTHDPCNADGTGTPGTAEKTLEDGAPVVTSDPFTLYAGFTCRLPGTTLEEIQRRADAAMSRGEERGVEYTFWTGVEGNDPHLADPSAVTVGVDLSPLAALSALEDYLGRTYYGQGIIHAPRGMASYLSLALLEVGGHLETKLGTRLAFGGGYSAANSDPDGDLAAPGKAWMYATGAVAIRRSPVFHNPIPLTNAFNVQTNEASLLAERTYVLATECTLGAVGVDLSCCPCL